jgi:hypothetical protein
MEMLELSLLPTTERIQQQPTNTMLSVVVMLRSSLISTVLILLVTIIECKSSSSVMPLKKEVWNELNCNKPQSRLAYLGKVSILIKLIIKLN